MSRGLNDLSGARHFRLPTTNPFPKLDQRITGPAASTAPRRGETVIAGQVGTLPEMAGDLLDESAQYAVENVKRDRVETRPWSRVGFGTLVGRVLGGHRAARP